MTHLKIEQNNGAIEEVSSAVIDKLYDIVNSGTLDNTSNLIGRLHTSATYQDYIDYLEDAFKVNGVKQLIIDATKKYISFADPLVESICRSNCGDGVGCTQQDLYNINSLSGDGFSNSNITSFNEFQYFNPAIVAQTNLFLNCSSLTEITLPVGTTSIGKNAFYGCISLDNIDLSSCTTIGQESFKGCTSLTEVDFNHNDVSTSFNSFCDCTGLTTIKNAENISTFGSAVFQGCTSLRTVTLKETANISNQAFHSCSNLEYVNGIKFGKDFSGELYNTFYNCTSLKCIDFDFSSTAYYDGTFYNCSSLQDLTTNDPTQINTGEQTYTFLGDRIRGGMFYECSQLQNKSFVFPNLTTITQYNTFYNCGAKSFSAPLLAQLGTRTFQSSKFQTINIPNVTSITEQTFINCTSLTSIDLSSNVTTIGQEAFKGCTALTTIGNLSNCTYIGRGAFQDCSNLDITDWDLSNVTTLGQFSFYNCAKLKGTLNLSGVTTLNAVANQLFYGCVLLEKIILGTMSNIMTSRLGVDKGTFYQCNSLKVVDINQLDSITFSNVILIDNNVFEALIIRNTTTIPSITLGQGTSTALWSKLTSSSNAKIYVTDALYSTYINHADWSDLASHIEPLSNYVAS